MVRVFVCQGVGRPRRGVGSRGEATTGEVDAQGGWLGGHVPFLGAWGHAANLWTTPMLSTYSIPFAICSANRRASAASMWVSERSACWCATTKHQMAAGTK